MDDSFQHQQHPISKATQTEATFNESPTQYTCIIYKMPRQPNPQNRLACDRCHGQKLRCPRQEGQGACQRCLRASATCIFSPRQKRTSPATTSNTKEKDEQIQPASQDPQHTDEIDMDLLDPDILFDPGQHPNAAPGLSNGFLNPSSVTLTDEGDWSTLMGLASPTASSCLWDFPMQPQSPSALLRGMAFPNASYRQDLASNTNTDSSTPANTPSSSTSTTSNHDCDNRPKSRSSSSKAVATTMTTHSCIRQLADLNVKLYDQLNSLPPVCPDISVDMICATEIDGPLIAIDEIFRMTQSLIDIMVFFYPPAATGTCAQVTPDTGTLMLLFSCADRVIDIFELLFSHMQSCLVNKNVPTTLDGKPFQLPQLRIGSYTPPAPTAMTVHMLTIILMASHLFDQLQEVLGVSRYGATDSSNPAVVADPDPFEIQLAVGTRSHFPNFTDEVKAAVTRRARSVAINIITARQLVLNLPGMYGSGSFSTFRETPKD